MKELLINRISKPRQYFVSMGIVLAVSAACFAFPARVDHHVVGFILLLTVSVIAVSFDILPVLFTAALTAFIWNLFFIPPRFTLHVGSTEDTILFIMYFVVAMVNAVLTYKIRQVEKVARKKEARANTIRLYNTLLNSLSHELRTPIAAIIAATDNLQENDHNLSAPDKTELVSEISKASLRLNQQVENLLNMSRLESGFIRPQYNWCDIAELTYDVVKRVEETSGRNIAVSIPKELPLFKTDKVMIEQVLYNLVNNAAIHTDNATQVEVLVTDRDGQLLMVVQDNGNGFPENETMNVFDKFYRLKNTRAAGTGLGLSIVKGFTEALKGTVKLENRPRGGAKFSISIAAETAPILYNE